MLLRVIAIDLAAGSVLILLWYFWFVSYNRRRSIQVLRWINGSFGSHGQVVGLNWLNPHRFKVQLQVAAHVFHSPSLLVQLLPREMPLSWLFSTLRHQQETLTFNADLDVPPSFNLEVHNHRWCGRTRRKIATGARKWSLEHTGPFVLTTRKDWHRDITNMMNALVASRECDCLSVCFRRTSPHFSATVPLQAIAPDANTDADIFDVLRELAAGASASRF